MKVLSVASEAYPWIKTGGLADVVGALPGAVAPHGAAMTTLLPGYPAVMRAIGGGSEVHRWGELMGAPARVIADGGLWVLDAPALFDRTGGPYADEDGREWADNGRRFAALARAAAELTKAHGFDLLHAHDWQVGLAPAYLRYARSAVRSVFTVHNLAFQGRFGRELFGELGLPDRAFDIEGVEYHNGVGFLKTGLWAADAITTVSPSYAEEIREPAFGMGLEGLIETRAGALHGIVNGIDPAVWSPACDSALPAPFDAGTIELRIVNKRALEAAFELEPGDGPLFVVVSRLAWQKGMDVLAGVIDALVAGGGRLTLLGAGDTALEQSLMNAAARHAGRVGARIGYDEPTSHLMQGGGDAILIPSRFEPCGLTQLYGLAYGCVPVVARTGGLSDTVIDANEAAVAAGVATGVQFDGVTERSLSRAIARATRLYARPDVWRTIQRRGMAADFSWAESGKRYAELYRALQ